MLPEPVKQALEVQKYYKLLEKWFMGPAREAAQKNFEECAYTCIQVAQSLGLAVIAGDEGKPPLHPDVQAAAEREFGTPAFAARANRFLGQIPGAASEAHRRRMAAVLMAGAAAIPEKERRDRVDVLVLQLLDSDVGLLEVLSDMTQEADNRSLHVVVSKEGELFLNPRVHGEGDVRPTGRQVDLLALQSLVGAGCAALGINTYLGGTVDVVVQRLQVTELGKLFVSILRKEYMAAALKGGPRPGDSAGQPG